MGLKLSETATPTTPAADVLDVFLGTDNSLKAVDDNGLVRRLDDVSLRGSSALVNGGFRFAQRQVPGTLTTYSNTTGRALGADVWGVTNENASVQYIRADTVAAAEAGLRDRYYGTYSKITNAGKFVVSQVIEASEMVHLRGRVVRIQVKLKASTTKTLRVALLELSSAGTTDTMPATFATTSTANGTDPTWGTNLSALTPSSALLATIVGAGLSCAVTTAWQQFSGTFTVSASCKNLAVVIFTDSDFSIADTFSIAEAGLYDGPELREWAPLPWELELRRCQRYYTKTFPIDTAPAQTGGVTGALRVPCTTAGAVATSVVTFWPYPTRMRTTPTLVFFNPAAANAFARNVTLGTDATATAAANATDHGTDWNCTGLAAWAVGNDIRVHATADASI